MGRILCTEDDADTRDLVEMMLQQAGYRVDCTESSNQAVQFARDRIYDLILVDNWMPEMSGDQVTKAIRVFNASTPILYYSGAAYEADKQHARDAGAQGYLVKPDGISTLVAEVARLITEARTAFPVAIRPPKA
jgi:DNA-binding response OmpR family regulator